MKLAAQLRPLVAPVAILVLHAALLYGLDAASVVDRLLGAVAPAPGLVALVAAFYLVRLAAFFVVPGWLVVATAQVVAAARRRAR